jgi:hypothetical protein
MQQKLEGKKTVFFSIIPFVFVFYCKKIGIF